MATIFGANSTTDDVLAGLDLSGKRALVTGVSSGLGVETARALAAHGAHVVGAVRDLEKARRATRRFGNIDLVELDLTSLTSVRTCADALVADAAPLDLVIANAGVMATPFGHTVEGFETQFGTNHLGHFVLVNRLRPLLRTGSRVVCLSSGGHRIADVDLEDPGFERTPYDGRLAYGRSKTANILFVVEFDRRYRDQGIRATAVHPGTIDTELSRHMGRETLEQTIASINANRPAGTPAFRFKSVAQGAATSVWAGVVGAADAVGGRYCENCQVAETVSVEGLRHGVQTYALDPERGKALWALSEKMVGERY